MTAIPAPVPSTASPLRSRVVAVALLALLALSSWAIAGRLLHHEGAAVGVGPQAGLDQSEFAAATGVWIEHVAVVGGAGLIDIRYRITDVERSEIVHDEENPPRIITADGLELRWTRHEHSHDRDNLLGRTYTEQLVNMATTVSPGDTVTVMIGNEKLEGVPVQ